LTIYLDAIWLMNFCFDIMLLFLTAIILKRNIVWKKIMIASLIGSAIVILLFSPFAQLASRPESKLILSCVMVLYAFGFKKFRYFIENLLTFYFVTFAVGGGMLGTYYFFQVGFSFQNNMILTNGNGFGNPVSWLFIVVGFPIIWYFSRLRLEQVEAKKIHYDQIVDVSITMMEKKVIVKGLIDSGNQLYDPITKKPVMIAEAEKLMTVFPESMHQVISNRNPMEAVTAIEQKEWIGRLKIIPYRSVGQDLQLLLAVIADEVVIHTKEESLMLSRPLIGLNHSRLSSEDDYQCIIHPKMIQTGKQKDAS
jgi:stage II sporulation protein GA (sporulation sigma-E factor processing peptidase)